ncbi:MAG: squalene/phytoene synthase family protein [Chthoniobacterales bacterium]|nr:squalene/phytoene synthase family protein [Chthoniobacterales bacterium]
MNAATITRQSKSNLALGFISLGRERRRDMTVLYAFCRVIDDIADSPQLSLLEKRAQLEKWRRLLHASESGEPPLAGDVRVLFGKYSISPAMLEEIIAGVEMDLTIRRYATFEQLRVYCHRVASAVGLASIEIFGYRNPRCKQYAIELGLALQMTNIIRDVEPDLRGDRIYIPQEDLARFNYSEIELKDRLYDDRFVSLMQFQAGRAWDFFSRAKGSLPAEDSWRMAPAEIMGAIYRSLLRRMERDRFRVFEKEYHLSKAEKAARIAGQLFKSFLNLPGTASV